MFEALVGEMEKSAAFVPDNATLVMFKGCAPEALLILMGVVVDLGNPTLVTLASAGAAQVPPAGTVTEGCGGMTQRFGPGGLMVSEFGEVAVQPVVVFVNVTPTIAAPN